MQRQVWLMVVCSPSNPFFQLPSKVFSIMLHIWFDPPNPLVFGLSHGICDQLLGPVRIHFFRCAHCGERMTSHNVVRDAFASIMKDVGYLSRLTFFHRLPFNLCINEPTL
jgi:hypothetical protein